MWLCPFHAKTAFVGSVSSIHLYGQAGHSQASTSPVSSYLAAPFDEWRVGGGWCLKVISGNQPGD